MGGETYVFPTNRIYVPSAGRPVSRQAGAQQPLGLGTSSHRVARYLAAIWHWESILSCMPLVATSREARLINEATCLISKSKQASDPTLDMPHKNRPSADHVECPEKHPPLSHSPPSPSHPSTPVAVQCVL